MNQHIFSKLVHVVGISMKSRITTKAIEFHFVLLMFDIGESL